MSTPWPVPLSAVSTSSSSASAEAEDAYVRYVRQWVDVKTDNVAVLQLRTALLAQDDETQGGEARPITSLLSTAKADESTVTTAHCVGEESWQHGLHGAVQWLSAGLSHLAQPGFTLCSTSLVREALRAVLHCPPGPSFTTGMRSEVHYTTTNDDDESSDDSHLLHILQRALPGSSETNYTNITSDDAQIPIATLVLMLFHRHRPLRLWARLTLVQSVTTITHASGADRMQTAHAVWRLAIELLCVLKHLQAVSLCTLGTSTTSTTLDATVCQLVGEAIYSLFALLTVLDEALTTTFTTTTKAGVQAQGTTLVHPVTCLLLGGTILLRWCVQAVPASLTTSFLGTCQRSALAASGYNMERTNYNATASSSLADDNDCKRQGAASRERDGLRRIMQALDSALGAAPSVTHIAPSLNTATAKSLVKVLVHLLLDHAKAVFAEPVTRATSLAHMRLLWYCASLVRPPSTRLQVPSLLTGAMRWVTPPRRCAGWMLRALLRNAESQFKVPLALQCAKARPGSGVDDNGISEHECDVLVSALLALHALFSSLLSELPALLQTRFMHELLCEQEQTIVAIAIGGVLRAHRHEGLDLLQLLMRADLSVFCASRSAPTSSNRAGSSGVLDMNDERAAQPLRCLSRVWANYPVMWRHALSPRCAAAPALLLAIAEGLVVLTEQPVWAEWLLLNADVGHAGPDGLATHVTSFIEHVVSDILEGCASDMTAVLRGSRGQHAAVATTTSGKPTVVGVFLAEQLLASGTPLPRFAQLLLFAHDTRLRHMGQALQRILLADLSSVVCDIYRTDTARWVWQRVILGQWALCGVHFLALQEVTIDGLARRQGAVWLRVLAACSWETMMTDVKSIMGAWWACALLVDNIALDAAAQQELIEKVLVQLPDLDTLCGKESEGDKPQGESTYHGNEYNAEEAKGDVDAQQADTDAEKNGCSEARLYAVMGHLLLCLLAKQQSYGPALLTMALCHIVRTLPERRVRDDAKLRTQFTHGLVKLWPRLSPAEQTTLQNCGVNWVATAAQNATRTIDDCIAAQERCFRQYEWEEKALQQAQREEAQGARAARALRERNVRERTAEIAAERQNSSKSASRSGASLSCSVSYISTGSSSNNTSNSDIAHPLANSSSSSDAKVSSDEVHNEQGVIHNSKTSRRLPPALLIAQERRMELYAVVERTRQGITSNDSSSIPARAPTALQRKLQALQERQARLQRHLSNEQDLQDAMRRMAVSTDVLRHPPYIEDIIGSSKLCLAPNIPVLPEIYTRDESTGGVVVDVDGEDNTPLAAVHGGESHDVGTIYANSFAPHVALELRFGICHAFQDLLEQCRLCRPAQTAPPPYYSPPPGYKTSVHHESSMTGGDVADVPVRPTAASRLASLAATLAHRFPLNPHVAREAIAVTHHGRSPPDPLHPTRLSFAVVLTCVTEESSMDSDSRNGEYIGSKRRRHHPNGQRAAAARQLNGELNEGDVVLVLLPLATLLPAWVRHQGGEGDDHGDGLVQEMERNSEILVRRLPAVWCTLGCLPQLCHVQEMQAGGLRGALLNTYSTAMPSSQHTGLQSSKRAREESNTEADSEGQTGVPPIRFSHALHVGFEAGTNAPFYLMRLASVSAAVTAIRALHDIHRTLFAPTIYNPRQTSSESVQYHKSLTVYFAQRGVLAAARDRLLIAHCLNDWQVRAISAVLYAVHPTWLPTSAMDIAKGYSAAVKTEAAATYMHPTMERFFYPQRTTSTDTLDTNTSVSGTVGSAASTSSTVLFMHSRVPNLLIIEGPPGTGKTQTIAALCHNLIHHLPAGSRVLLCAPSNCAVDEALLRTVHLQSELRRHSSSTMTSYGNETSMRTVRTADMVRVGVRRSVATDVLSLDPCVYLEDRLDKLQGYNNNSMNETSRNGRKRALLQGTRNTLRQSILSEATLVFATLGSLHQLQRLELRFDVVIVDEASQGTEPDVLLALLLAKRQCILVGDSRQLQPTVLCRAAAQCGLQRSLLVRLLHNGHRSFMLRTQYRMHPDICAFPNAYFYQGQLHTATAVLRREGLDSEAQGESLYNRKGQQSFYNSGPSFLRLPFRQRTLAQRLYGIPRFAFVNVARGVMQRGRGHSWQNTTEAAAVVQYMRQLRTVLQLSVEEFGTRCGIISFYRAQRDALMQALSHRERGSGLQIATVDSFQGKEKDIIFISCVRALSEAELQRIQAACNNNNSNHTVSGDNEEEEEGMLGDEEEEDESAADERQPQAPRSESHATRHTLGFLSDWHRINVSLTRAREMCLVFGHAPTLQAGARVAERQKKRRNTSAQANTSSHMTTDATTNTQHRATQVGDSAETIRGELRKADEDPLVLPRMLEHIRRCMTGSAPCAPQPPSEADVVDLLTPEDDGDVERTKERRAEQAHMTSGTVTTGEEGQSVCVVEGGSSSSYRPHAAYIEYYAQNRMIDELQRSSSGQHPTSIG